MAERQDAYLKFSHQSNDGKNKTKWFVHKLLGKIKQNGSYMNDLEYEVYSNSLGSWLYLLTLFLFRVPSESFNG